MLHFTETIAETELDFVNIALSYGQMIQSRKNAGFIDLLTAAKKQDVQVDSLSKRYGLESFPIHTDCAYFRVPPRYIFLRYVGSFESPSPTFLIDFETDKLDPAEQQFVKNAIWYVKGSEGGFYTTIYENGVLRYDPEIMKPVNNVPYKMSDLLEKMRKSQINWHSNKVLIINNWSTLHARPTLKPEENGKRILQRINIQ
ncbi:MAG TPA: hypothetical protein VK772_15165 [Puia sp.]|jgi:L-asparagine oxygenase|nr:hypothetical protein [Puia sp.]